MGRIDKRFILENCLTIFFEFNILSGILGDNLFFKIRYFVAFFVIFIEIKDKRIIFKVDKRNFVFILIYFVMGIIPASSYNHNTDGMFLIIQIMYFLLAYILISEELSNYIFNILINMLHIVCGIYFLLYFSGNKAMPLFVGVSTNYISVYYIVLFTLYLMIDGGKNRDLKIAHLLLAMIFSLLAGGRGGILSMGVIILISLFVKRNKKSSAVIVLFSLFFVVLLILTNFNKVSEIFYRFSEMGIDSNGRYKFWSDYLNNCKISFGNIIFGANIQNSLSRYYYYIPHLHNSYLTIYGYCGLFPTLYLIYLLIKSIRVSWKNGYRKFTAVLISFFVRSYTDIVFGGFIGDIVIYSIVFWVNMEIGKKEIKYGKNL